MGFWQMRCDFNTRLWQMKAKRNRKKYPELVGNPANISILSVNCIGGMVSHELNMRFCSPTVNLFLTAEDFLKFCENLQEYLQETPQDAGTDEKLGYPILKLKDIYLYGVHYKNAEECAKKWESRKKRINPRKLFLIFSDRDGFDESMLDRIAALPYKKVLFSAREYPDYDFVVPVPLYQGQDTVGNMTLFRKFLGPDRIYSMYPFEDVLLGMTRASSNDRKSE